MALGTVVPVVREEVHRVGTENTILIVIMVKAEQLLPGELVDLVGATLGKRGIRDLFGLGGSSYSNSTTSSFGGGGGGGWYGGGAGGNGNSADGRRWRRRVRTRLWFV